MPDAVDFRIVHALQAAARAPWDVVGQVAGVSGPTAARRWERLRRDGLAWIVTYPGATFLNTQCTAFVEVQIHSGAIDLVATLARDGKVATIQRVAGDSDLLLTVMTSDLDTLGDWVQELAASPKVARTRTRVVMQVFGESERWRVSALGDEDESVLARYRARHRPMSHSPDDADLALIAHLALDGRRSAVDLAADSGLSAPTVRRRLESLVAERILSIRCEVAHVLGGWPVTANLWARVRPQALTHLMDALAEFPQIRVCCEVTGTANILMTVWLRRIGELPILESDLETVVPGFIVVDRAVTFDTPKRLGSLLDRSGRCTDFHPLELLTAESV
ncbi:Lrp/AsnC family transcriptional regulator [Tsukamurella sp. 8F]|uniref:Lrp/AsnC family transcriptional regulator n=1 Tax=unclassified Tsukamurella TaxID=2633480 RepID=UPI0023B98F9E|nr:MULTISPECIES: Lrp/AsnC family transcriptional regulator [unclassified Tsukamurella]MDF0531258.1 Lrp/AsnC family transcriptional regulator [Tsukamurella sp. 8J]MDF0585207.1 Lrp/AsnC family transcriptional regulator [Tsukamurella sp. 8F]